MDKKDLGNIILVSTSIINSRKKLVKDIKEVTTFESVVCYGVVDTITELMSKQKLEEDKLIRRNFNMINISSIRYYGIRGAIDLYILLNEIKEQ